MYKITSDFSPSDAENQILSDALMAFNESVFKEKVQPLSIFLKDETKTIRGGVVAYLQSDSIHIDIVWVDEAIRGQGHGEKLLKTAEGEAKKYGCSFSTVNTMDFQAEGFYLKHGYERICEFKNYILDHTRIFLRKNLKQAGKDTELIGGIEKVDITIVKYDPNWPKIFANHEKKILQALGEKAIQIEHIGSTAVPGLSAKPIIDILLVVKNSGDEADYLPILERAGYVLRGREPEFYEHRLMRTPEKDLHIHIFSPDSPEIERYLLFRNRLREYPQDRTFYESIKRKLASYSWPDMQAYADAKTEVVEGIIAAARAQQK